MNHNERPRPEGAASAGLEAFGYTQRLDRSLSRFALFALQYSYLSVLTGVFELFGEGFGFGGPAMVWAWAAVFAGQLLVALLFMELSAHYPIAGSVYNWSKKLNAPAAAWMAGWLMIFTAVTTLAAVALAAQILMPTIWSGFQIVHTGSAATSYSENAVLLGGVMIALTTFINCLRVSVVGFINNIAVAAEILGCLVLIVLFFVHAHRSPAVLGRTLGTGHGHTLGYLGAFLVASFIGAYQFFGFDTAGSLAEESPDPHRRAPRSILQALASTFVLGFLLLAGAMIAIPHLGDPALATGGLPYLVTLVLGTVVGKILLAAVMLSVFGCGLAIQAAGTRMIFAMARDDRLPFSHALARLSETSKSALVPNIVVGVIAFALLLINIKSSQIIAIVTSIAAITCAGAYLCVTVPMLRARARRTWPVAADDRRGLFGLGRFGLAVNALAVLWGVGLLVNLLWPRKAVYNAIPPFHWYLPAGPILFMLGVVGVGIAYYALVARHKVGTLAEHKTPGSPSVATPEGEATVGSELA